MALKGKLIRFIETRKTFLKIFRGYAVIVTVCVVLVGILLYTAVSRNMEKQLSTLNTEMLVQLSRSFDDLMFTKLDVFIARMISANSNYEYLANHNPIDNVPLAARFIGELGQLSDFNDFVESVYLFKNRERIIISTDGITSVNDEGYVDASVKGMYDTAWIPEMALFDGNRKWLRTRSVSKLGKKGSMNVFTYVRNLTPDRPAENSLFIAVNIYVDKLYSIIKSYNTPGNIIILNNNGEVIVSNDDGSLALLFDERQYGNIDNGISGYYVSHGYDGKYFVSFVESAYNGWKYISVTAYHSAFQALDIVRNIVITLCVLVWAVILLLSGVVSGRQYKPLRDLVLHVRGNLFDSQSPLREAKREDEYNLVKNAFDSYNRNLSSLQQKIAEDVPVIRNNLLSMLLLDGSVDPQDIAGQLLQYGCQLQGDGDNYVCVLSVRKTSGNGRRLRFDEVENIKNFIKGIAKESFENGEGVNLHPVWIGQYFAFIIHSDNGWIDKKRISTIFRHICQKCILLNDLSIKVGVSSPGKQPLSYTTLYGEAIEALQQQYVSGDEENIYFCEEIRHTFDLNASEFKTIADKLGKTLNTSNLDECRNSLEEAVALMQARNVSAALAKQAMLALVAVVVNDIQEKHESLSDFCPEEHGYLGEFDRQGSLEEAKSWMLGGVANLLETRAEKRLNKNGEIVERIKQFILVNMNQNISLDNIAAKMHFSPDHLRYLFKKSTGTTFLAYLHSIKMEKAREMILSSDSKVEEIALNLGYGSSNYFIKKFKEYYGFTPKEYRTQYEER